MKAQDTQISNDESRKTPDNPPEIPEKTTLPRLIHKHQMSLPIVIPEESDISKKLNEVMDKFASKIDQLRMGEEKIDFNSLISKSCKKEIEDLKKEVEREHKMRQEKEVDLKQMEEFYKSNIVEKSNASKEEHKKISFETQTETIDKNGFLSINQKLMEEYMKTEEGNIQKKLMNIVCKFVDELKNNKEITKAKDLQFELLKHVLKEADALVKEECLQVQKGQIL